MLFQILLFYLFISATAADPSSPEKKVEVCDDNHCKTAAAFLTLAMNKSVDPCDDFYAYSCGSWASNFPLPSNKEIWNLDEIMEYDATHTVKEILEEEESANDTIPLLLEKVYYRSCMDLDRIEEEGVKPVEEILNYLGGWPMVMGEDWNSDVHDWQTIHEYYSSFRDLSSLFDIRASPDSRNLQNNTLTLFKPTESLYESLLKNRNETNVNEKYTEFVKNVALIFMRSTNKTVSDEEILKDIEELLAFESSLYLIKRVAEIGEEDVGPMRTYSTIKEMQDFYDKEDPHNETSKINWLETFKAVCKNVDSVIVDESIEVGFDGPYLIKLFNLLETTPNRVIVNYVHWKFISSSMKYLNKEVRDLLSELTVKPDDVVPERWEECISDMKFRMGYKLAYISRHHSDDTKKMMNYMTNELRSAMLDEIEHADWVDADTKEETMIKLHKLTWQIGSPFTDFHRRFVDSLISGVAMTLNYFENVQTAREVLMKFNVRRVLIKNSHKFIRVNQLRSLATYDRWQNVLVITAAQTANPLLESTLPQAMHYGYMGPTLGHLMAQTLEKNIDTNGYMAPWSSYLGETYKSYETKTACLRRQYDGYSVGPATIDENMYNAIGLKVAYDAFQANVEKEFVEKLTEFEEMTNDQLFFVSYALKYCQNVSPKYVDEHDPAFFTPSDYKVIGTLSNFEHFAKAFNCPAGSFMNPQDKCVI